MLRLWMLECCVRSGDSMRISALLPTAIPYVPIIGGDDQIKEDSTLDPKFSCHLDNLGWATEFRDVVVIARLLSHDFHVPPSNSAGCLGLELFNGWVPFGLPLLQLRHSSGHVRAELLWCSRGRWLSSIVGQTA